MRATVFRFGSGKIRNEVFSVPPSVATTFVLALICLTTPRLQAASPSDLSPARVILRPTDSVGAALEQAGTNRIELSRALESVSGAERQAMEFLIANMPARDRQSLSAAFLLENVKLACAARREFPLAKQVPDEIFLNDVLPYASVTERRDAWRKRLREICVPLVGDCQTLSAVARRLNERLFGLVHVKYSTSRKRPDQSPNETMESGVATCTGLSILLVDACRSVGVPARVVGTPMWMNNRGNHTWVEIWDGRWHFLGAAEPDPNGLDRGWFVHDAAQARKDDPGHAIYATSFQRTGSFFPLAWARRSQEVNAINVTDAYTGPEAPSGEQRDRLLVKVLDGAGGKRVSASVRIVDVLAPDRVQSGTSKDESADLNDLLAFRLLPDHPYRIEVQSGERHAVREYRSSADPEHLIVVDLSQPEAPIGTGVLPASPGGACVAPSTFQSVPPVYAR